MQDDAWHFSRSALAEHYLNALDTGLAIRLILSAPRRKGKTEFLLRDVVPLACKRGYRVLYTSMWDNLLAPQRALLTTLSTAAKPHGWSRLLETELHKLTLKGPLGLGAEFEMKGTAIAPSADELAEIGRLLRHHANAARHGLLLLIDEIQHLVTRPTFMPLAATLRTALDEIGPAIRVIYTGSATAAIKLMFARRQAVFYASANEAPFPDLPRDYVEHLARVFHEVTARQLDVERAWEIFNRLDCNPGHMAICLREMVLYPTRTLAETSRNTQERIALEEDFAGRLRHLDALDRALIMELLDNAPLFAKATRERVGSVTGRLPTTSQVQRRVEKLMSLNLIMPGAGRGEYVPQDTLFIRWCVEKFRKK